MKTFLTSISILFISILSSQASTSYYHNTNKPFVFHENGIEFAVFNDGEIDFNIIEPIDSHIRVRSRHIDFSFNTGYDYDPYIQYDPYGAVIQVENTPIYYNNYGKVLQVGSVHLDYNQRGLVNRIGNLHVYYNRFGEIRDVTGFVNRYNRVNTGYYGTCSSYRRPSRNRVIVYNTPYRRNLSINRCSYNNYRRDYYTKYRPIVMHHNFRRPTHVVVYNNRGTRYNNVQHRISPKRTKVVTTTTRSYQRPTRVVESPRVVRKRKVVNERKKQRSYERSVASNDDERRVYRGR